MSPSAAAVMRLFAVASLAPLPLILAGAAWGGPWIWLALAWMSLLTATLDEVVHRVTPALPEGEGGAFPLADGLSVMLALGHLAALVAVVAALSGPSLGWAEKAGLFAAAGLFFGQVSNSNAHELIHRGRRGLHRLGVAVYVSLLFGHHASAHLLVHHRHVATRSDPNSARLGEGFYRYAGRAWVGSFRAGLQGETARLQQLGRPFWRHPYLAYLAGAALALWLAYLIGGGAGLAALAGLAAFAQVQLLMSDYVQHYGLVRAIGADGRPAPVAPRHSWNSPHWFSSALMLNAPRHSDHHAHPARRYPALGLPEAPMLPRSLPVMACVALHPRLWRRVMDPRARAWRDGPA